MRNIGVPETRIGMLDPLRSIAALFVIMASAQNRSAIKFALLRALRLYPAFIACLSITIIGWYCLNKPVPSSAAVFLNGLIVNNYFRVPNIGGVY